MVAISDLTNVLVMLYEVRRGISVITNALVMLYEVRCVLIQQLGFAKY